MIKIGKSSSLVALRCLCCFGWIVATDFACAQDADLLPDEPGYALLAELPKPEPLPTDPGQIEQSPANTSGITLQREATWRSLPGDILHDQKGLWTFPLKVAKGHYLLPVAIVIGGTAGLIYADPHAMPYFRSHQKNLDDVNDVFDPMITTGEVIALPAGLLAAGYIRHDGREVNTALLATEAYVDSLVINLAIKAVTRRSGPPTCRRTATSKAHFLTVESHHLRAAVFRQDIQRPCGQWQRWWRSGIGIVASHGFRCSRIRLLPRSVARASPKWPTSLLTFGSVLPSDTQLPSIRH